MNLEKLTTYNMKRCSKCKEIKMLENFGKNKSHKDGLQNNCKECSHKFDANYRVNNQEYFDIYQRKYRKDRYHSDITFKLTENLRGRLRKALKFNSKRGSAVKDLGCSIDDFKWWLEFWFEEGMTWDNYGHGRGKWNIDHIIPLSKVNLQDKKEFLKVNNYKNLQPMWHVDNVSKFNRI